MISHTYQCIFVHIPKTAGTSIEKKLELFQQLERGVQDHRTIQEIQKFIPESQFRSYFKFSFVRNPWARVFSWYQNVMRDPNHQKALGILSGCSFRQFAEYGLFKNWALRPQTYWIQDKEGCISMDFVGRFERLEQDFAQVCDVLKIKDRTLPKLLHSAENNYAAHYDEKTRDIVANRYREEIQAFNYQFEDPFYKDAPRPPVKKPSFMPPRRSASFVVAYRIYRLALRGIYKALVYAGKTVRRRTELDN